MLEEVTYYWMVFSIDRLSTTNEIPCIATRTYTNELVLKSGRLIGKKRTLSVKVPSLLDLSS